MSVRRFFSIVVFLIAALNLQFASALPSSGGGCDTAPASRIHVGMQARIIVDSLNIRALPAVDTGINGRLYHDTLVNVIGGPSCNGHKRWWRVETSNGVRGWIAEGTWESFYLIPAYAADQPVPSPLEWTCGATWQTRKCFTAE